MVALVDADGNVLASYEYDAFGNQTASTGTFDNPYRYAGELYDSETSQYYLRSRYYDPGLGRFVSEDSYGGDPNSPLTLNRYTYGLNNPLVYVDPSGHISLRLWEKKAQDQWAALGRGVVDFAGDMVEGMAKMTVGLLEGAAEFAADPVGQTQQAVKSLSDGSLAEKDPLSHVTTYSHDAKGNRTGQVDRNGGTTTFTYDKLEIRTWRWGPPQAAPAATQLETDQISVTVVHECHHANRRVAGR